MSETIVVKIGTSSLTQPETGHLALSTIATLVETLVNLRQRGYGVVLVSSGAVGVGCARLGLIERPRTMSLKQAVAAVGQGRLMRVYDDLFSSLNQPIAQVLLTRSDLVERHSYVNASNTFKELLQLGVIPIVNENDTVAIEELKFGDNDNLSALVASLVEATWLFLMTDVEQLYSADPRVNPDAQPISFVENMEQLEQFNIETGGSKSGWGTGGMMTKIEAAKVATASGVMTVIMKGQFPQNLLKILQGESIGTKFAPQPRPVHARKHWIANVLIPMGKLYLDQGAIKAITEDGKSLLAAGITQVEGNFQGNESVSLCNLAGEELARGLVNYSGVELDKIKGCHSEQIAKILGYEGEATVIHRDNLVIF